MRPATQTAKELVELRRDPRLFGIVVLAPIIQLLLLGYAATTDVRNVPIVVADADRSSASRELIARFEASPYFTIAGTDTIVAVPDSKGNQYSDTTYVTVVFCQSLHLSSAIF